MLWHKVYDPVAARLKLAKKPGQGLGGVVLEIVHENDFAASTGGAV